MIRFITCGASLYGADIAIAIHPKHYLASIFIAFGCLFLYTGMTNHWGKLTPRRRLEAAALGILALAAGVPIWMWTSW